MSINNTAKRIEDLKKYMVSCGFKQRLDVTKENAPIRDIIYQKGNMLIHFNILQNEGYLLMNREQFRSNFSKRKILLDDQLIGTVSMGIY